MSNTSNTADILQNLTLNNLTLNDQFYKIIETPTNYHMVCELYGFNPNKPSVIIELCGINDSIGFKCRYVSFNYTECIERCNKLSKISSNKLIIVNEYLHTFMSNVTIN